VAVHFIDGGNRSIQRKPSTSGKSLTNFIPSHNAVSSTPRLSGIRTRNLLSTEASVCSQCISRVTTIFISLSTTCYS